MQKLQSRPLPCSWTCPMPGCQLGSKGWVPSEGAAVLVFACIKLRHLLAVLLEVRNLYMYHHFQDPIILHKKFIDECYNRLEVGFDNRNQLKVLVSVRVHLVVLLIVHPMFPVQLAISPLSASALAQVVSSATKLLLAVVAPEQVTMPSPSRWVDLAISVTCQRRLTNRLYCAS